MYLHVDRITCRYGARPVLADFSLEVPQGDYLVIVGPNGSGKSTLAKAINRTLRPVAGRVLLDGRDIYALPAKELYREMAVVSQETAIDFEFTVEEVVALGRLPHLKRFRGETEADIAAVHRALALTSTLHLKDRLATGLSGGERQRVMVARALAQEPRLLILDEPTAHLDIAHQIELLDLTRELNRTRGLTVIAVLHDLNLAAQYASHMLMIKAGERFAQGGPEQVLTEDNILAVYGSRVRVMQHPVYGTPHVFLLSGQAPREAAD